MLMIILTFLFIYVMGALFGFAVKFAWNLFKIFFKVGLYIVCPILFILALVGQVFSAGIWPIILIVIICLCCIPKTA